MNFRGIPVALITLMLCLVPVAQAWGSTPYQSLDAPDIDLLTPPSVSLSEEQVEFLSNVQGYFVENLGQLEGEEIDYYCIGQPLSIAFGTSMVSYDHRPAGTDMGAMFHVRFTGSCNLN